MILTETALSTPQIAEWAGHPQTTIWRWAGLLGYPTRGSGSRLKITQSDALVMAAWSLLNGERAGNHWGIWDRIRWQAAEAIRARPAPYVVVLPDRAFTVDTWEAAVTLAAALGRPGARWLIDLTTSPLWPHLDPT